MGWLASPCFGRQAPGVLLGLWSRSVRTGVVWAGRVLGGADPPLEGPHGRLEACPSGTGVVKSRDSVRVAHALLRYNTYGHA